MKVVHCAVTCTWKAYLLLKRQLKTSVRQLLWHYSHFRWLCWLSWKTISLSHNIFTLVLKAYCPKIHLTPLIKGRISIKCLIPFHIFDVGLLIWRKKHQPTSRRCEQEVVTLVNRSGSRLAEPLNSQATPPNLSSSLPDKVILLFIWYYYESSPTSLKTTSLLLTLCWVQIKPATKREARDCD